MMNRNDIKDMVERLNVELKNWETCYWSYAKKLQGEYSSRHEQFADMEMQANVVRIMSDLKRTITTASALKYDFPK